MCPTFKPVIEFRPSVEALMFTVAAPEVRTTEIAPPWFVTVLDVSTLSTTFSVALPPPIIATAPPELLLRVLDAPPIRVRHIPLADLLRPAYRDLTDHPA